ncbi:MAG: Eco57I restriction-modification methylase domain-containing protein [Peptococcales bacterium]|jgi:site-specific DNA-methyltransferase (adenine-specific)
MSLLFEKVYNPDILNCLANLSNDEVFTPPEVVNKMLDMLPQELFRNPNTTFLDPACKTGVFLREIAKRLLEGLKNVIPNEEERRKHIFTKQLYGIAITELTSLLSRRSLYCSKYANTVYSIVPFDNVEGNIRFKNTEHYWEGNKCGFCGASKSQYDREEGLEQHAYEFIHTSKPEEILGMTFDVIASNVPYQLNDGGGSGTSSMPIYQKFVEQAIKLNPRYITMIIPSRWFSGGKGLDSFRDTMLNDRRLVQIHDYIEAADCFPGVQIKGGVCYFLWDRDNPGDCLVTTYKDNQKNTPIKRPLLEKNCDVFIRYNEGVDIYRKVISANEDSFEELVSTRRPFGFSSKFRGRKNRTKTDDVLLYQNGGTSFVARQEILRNEHLVDKWKVFIPFLGSGSDTFPHMILGKPFVGAPGTACTETYLVIEGASSENEAKNIISYIATRFFRFLVLLKKPSQNATKKVYSFVPQQDFTRPWTDEELYKKYNISESEIGFIESMIRPMD